MERNCENTTKPATSFSFHDPKTLTIPLCMISKYGEISEQVGKDKPNRH